MSSMLSPFQVMPETSIAVMANAKLTDDQKRADDDRIGSGTRPRPSSFRPASGSAICSEESKNEKREETASTNEPANAVTSQPDHT